MTTLCSSTTGHKTKLQFQYNLYACYHNNKVSISILILAICEFSLQSHFDDWSLKEWKQTLEGLVSVCNKKKKKNPTKSICSWSTAIKWTTFTHNGHQRAAERQHNICNASQNSCEVNRMHLYCKQWILAQKVLVTSVWEMRSARQASLRIKPTLWTWVRSGADT